MFVWVGAMERRWVLVVIILYILVRMAVVSSRKQYAPSARSNDWARMRGSRWEIPGARGWAGVTGIVTVVWKVITGCSRVKAYVLVTPVEGGNSGDGSVRWQVDGFNSSFAGGSDNFHNKRERGRVELALCGDVEDHVEVDVGGEVRSVIAVGYDVDGVLCGGGVGVQWVASEEVV